MNSVFRALADPGRRRILDLLRERGGRPVGEICGHFRTSRFAIMKHLGVLRRARLVAVRREGRRSLHYLNPVPLQEMADRWISPFARATSRALLDLKRSLESKGADRAEASPPGERRKRA